MNEYAFFNNTPEVLEELLNEGIQGGTPSTDGSILCVSVPAEYECICESHPLLPSYANIEACPSFPHGMSLEETMSITSVKASSQGASDGFWFSKVIGE